MPQDRLKDWEDIDESKQRFSDWHRKNLPGWCYLTDGDWFEVRSVEGKITVVAYYEIIAVSKLKELRENPEEEYPPSGIKADLLLEIQKFALFPCYFVWTNSDLTQFYIRKAGERKGKKLNSEETAHFFLMFGKREWVGSPGDVNGKLADYAF